MKYASRNLAMILVCGTLVVAPGLAGCDQQDGPAERLGEKIDDTVEQVGDKVEDAADTIEDKTD